MAAKSKPLDQLDVAGLGISEDVVGARGAGQEVFEVANAEERQVGDIVEDDGEGYAKVVAFLETLKLI